MSEKKNDEVKIEALSDDDLDSVAGGLQAANNSNGTCNSNPECQNNSNGTCNGGDEIQ